MPHDHDPHSEQEDPLWSLLAQAPLARPEPWFATRTLALCRTMRLEIEAELVSIRRIWRWAFGGGIGICLAVTILVVQVHSEVAETKQQRKVQEAFEVVASLGSDADSSASATPTSDSSSL